MSTTSRFLGILVPLAPAAAGNRGAARGLGGGRFCVATTTSASLQSQCSEPDCKSPSLLVILLLFELQEELKLLELLLLLPLFAGSWPL